MSFFSRRRFRSDALTNRFRFAGTVGPPPPKKHKSAAPRDVSFAEAAKFGTQSDFSFFDKVRNVLRNNDVYDNFLRCLLLFNNEVVSKSELLAVTAAFFTRHPELQRWLQEFLGLAPGASGGSPSQASAASSPPPVAVPVHNAYNNSTREPLSTHPPHPYSLLTAQGEGFLCSVYRLTKLQFVILRFVVRRVRSESLFVRRGALHR